MIRTCRHCQQKNRVPAARLGSPANCGKCKQPLGPLAEPVDVDPVTFDEVLRDSRLPVLVDFWAAWCGPCRTAAPEVARTAAGMAGKAVVLKVDTERYPEIAARYGVQGIPNFVVLKNGVVRFQQAGVARHTDMQRWLEDAGKPG